MATDGLSINNGNGERVVDSEYTGVYYIGKAELDSPNNVSIPGYDNQSVPPLVFLKLPKTAGNFASVSSLSFLDGVAPGGAGTVTMTVPSGVVYSWYAGDDDQNLTSIQCTEVGGIFSSTNHGGCRYNGNLELSTDEYVRGNNTVNQGANFVVSSRNNFNHTGTGDKDLRFNSFSTSISVSVSSGVVDTSTVSVVNPGHGWSVNDTAFLGNDGAYLLSGAPSNHTPSSPGWYPFDTDTNTYYDPNDNHCTNCDNADGTGLGFTDSTVIPQITVTALAQGWTSVIQGNFNSSDPVTVYYYGVGGESPATNDFGLVIRDSSKNVTFNSNRPPPIIREITNISFTNLRYDDDASGSAGYSQNANEVLDLVDGDTAMYSIPIAPTTQFGYSAIRIQEGPPTILNGVTNFYSPGLRFRTSGSSIVGLTFESTRTATEQAAGGTCVFNGPNTYSDTDSTVNTHTPFWNIESPGSADVSAQTLGVCSLGTYSIPTWNVNQDCIFINTRIIDDLPY